MCARPLYVMVLLTLVLATAAPVMAQETGKATASPKSTLREVRTLIIKGVIEPKDSGDGYLIRGDKPWEVFTILNPNPQVLSKLARSGQKLTIEAQVVQGDNIRIRKINGKLYVEGSKPASK